MLGGRRLEQRPVNLDFDVLGQQPAENLGRFGLVDVVDDGADVGLIAGHSRLRDRQQRLGRYPLLHDRLELVVDDDHLAGTAADERLDRGIGDTLGIGVLHALEDADFLERHGKAPALEEVAPFSSNQAKFDASGPRPGDIGARRLDDVRVEAAAQPLVCRDDDQQRLRPGALLVLDQEGMQRGIDPARHAVQHALHLPRVRAGADDAILRPAQLRRRDHLHRLGDLLGRFHRADAPAQVEQ